MKHKNNVTWQFSLPQKFALFQLTQMWLTPFVSPANEKPQEPSQCHTLEKKQSKAGIIQRVATGWFFAKAMSMSCIKPYSSTYRQLATSIDSQWVNVAYTVIKLSSTFVVQLGSIGSQPQGLSNKRCLRLVVSYFKQKSLSCAVPGIVHHQPQRFNFHNQTM